MTNIQIIRNAEVFASYCTKLLNLPNALLSVFLYNCHPPEPRNGFRRILHIVVILDCDGDSSNDFSRTNFACPFGLGQFIHGHKVVLFVLLAVPWSDNLGHPEARPRICHVRCFYVIEINMSLRGLKSMACPNADIELYKENHVR